MTQKEIVSFRREFEGAYYKSYVNMVDDIEKALMALGIGTCKDVEDAQKQFSEMGLAGEVEDHDVVEVYMYADFLCFIVKVREYYIDPGSVDYLYSYEFISD